jgi:hypothetical protein
MSTHAHPWRDPWSASPAAAGPPPQRFLTQGRDELERAVRRMYAAGSTAQTIAAAVRLPEHRIQAILRRPEE